MAEQLGEAVLRITIDDDAARDQLRALRQEIEGTTGATRTSRARRSTAGSGGILGPQNGPGIDRDTVRRFNLRGLNAALESIAEDINSIRTARQVNIGSSWTKALEFLQETKENIDSISASKNLNLRSSWSTALALLSETKEDIDSISASKNLNIRSSWSAALALLSETKEDIDSISASKNLNLRASWAKALGQLSEIQEDLTQVAAAKDLNLNASWAGALATLSEIDADLQNIAAGKKLNIRASWQTALRQLQETADEAARIRLDENIAQGRRIGAQNVSPIRGGAAFPGSPAYLDAIFPKFPEKFFKDQNKRVQDAAKRRADILSNALIGGAFPALFGQGLGASLGGAAGGAAGGALGGQFGFGLSLIGTALGAQFDAALNKAKELAKALDNPIAQFSAIKENALLSSKSLEKNVEALIATGREAEAAALIQQDLTNLFGDAQGAKDYQNAVDKLNRSYTQATVILANFVAGPLADLINSITQPYKEQQVLQRFLAARDTLNPEQRSQVQAFDVRTRREKGIGVFASEAQRIAQYLALLEEIRRVRGEDNGALERAIRNQKILTESAATLVRLEQDIDRARIGGNKPLEASLELQKKLVASYRERKDLEGKFTRGDISADEFSQKFKRSQTDDIALQQNYVDATRESFANSVNELQATKQLSGLEGTRLDVAQRRLDIEKAATAVFQRRTEYIDAIEKFNQDTNNFGNRIFAQGALQELGKAGVDFEIKLRQASDYLVKAAKDARQNLTAALVGLGKLESDPGGLNRFLTRDEQFESNRRAILRLSGDGSKGPSQLESAITKATELLGLTRNQANERFQGLRDIVSGARQGRFASQEGFNTLSGFIQDTLTREQAVTGVGDAQKTLADITSLNVTVQKELSTAVKENTVALNAVFGKDWSVNLAVQGGEVAAYGDVISRNLTP